MADCSKSCADKCEKKQNAQLARALINDAIIALRAVGGDTNDNIVVVLKLLLVVFCNDKCGFAAEGPNSGAVVTVNERGLTVNFGPDNAYTFSLPLENDAARMAFASKLLKAVSQLTKPLPPQGSSQLSLPFHS